MGGLAEASGIKVDAEHGGFLVNEQFEACPNLWVAGDAAPFRSSIGKASC